MSLTKVRIVARGPAAYRDEVWVDGVHVPGVRAWRAEGDVNEIHTVTLTILADPVTVEYEPDQPDRNEVFVDASSIGDRNKQYARAEGLNDA